MKITRETAAAGYLNKINAGNNNMQKTSANGAGKNFDQLMISTNSKQVAEEKIETAARKEVAKAVYQQDSADKISALKEQVSQGMYKVDPEAVAAKILFWRGEQ